jgi:hypothetical protein
MPDSKISELTAITGINVIDTDVFLLAETDTPDNKKITRPELLKALVGEIRSTTAFWHTGNGYGSTDTMIARFTTQVDASDDVVVTVTNTAANGFKVTANMACWLYFTYAWSAGTGEIGISKNSSELTTIVESITAADRLTVSDISRTDTPTSVSWGGLLANNDIIRPHTHGVASVALASVNVLAIEKIEQ